MMIRGITSFLRGIGFKNIRAAYYAWFFNFLFSIFVYWGYYKVFSQAAGESVLAFDGGSEVGVFTFLMDIAHNHPGSLGLVFSLAGIAGFLYFVISVFIAGGIYGTFVEDERTSFTNLLALSLEYYFDMIKMFLVNLVNLILMLILPVIGLLVFLGIESFRDNETALKTFFFIWFSVVLLIWVIASFVYDFSRIYKIKEGKSLVSAFKAGFRFTFGNKRSLLVIGLMYVLSLLILYLLNYLFIILTQGFLFATLFFLVLQAFVWVRYYLRIVVIRAEVHLVREAEKTPVVEKPAQV